MGTAPKPEKVRPSGTLSLPDRYRAVQRIVQAVALHRDMETLFRAWVAELRAVFSLRAIGIVHHDDIAGEIKWSAVDIADQPHHLTPPMPWADSAWRSVYESQQPLVVNLTDRAASLAAIAEFLTRIGTRSACLLPLTSAHRKLGALVFASEYPRYFSDDVVDFLTLITLEVAVGMDNALNFAASQMARSRLESETVKLKLLLEMNEAIVADLDLDSILQVISPSLQRLFEVDAVSLILPDTGDNGLRVRAVDFPGRPKDSLQHIPVDRQDSVAAQVFSSGRPWVGNVQPLGHTEQADPGTTTPLRTICALPLIRRNRVLGVLGLGRVRETAFAREDVEFLLQAANQLAFGVENALAYGDRTGAIIHPDERVPFDEEIRGDWRFEEIIGKSKALRHVLQQVEAVAPTETSALICGETGTGKELVARAIHKLSLRSRGPFVTVNCAALPAGLLESELFGHEKGAFTGALSHRQGRFELANRGTIFLDEIGELPLELQPKLLRVLQDGEFERLGSSRTLRTNARLVAATNRDLATMVNGNQFRVDLFYRLSVFPLYLPALRDRREDIPLLARHFTAHFARSLGKRIDSISSETMNALLGYTWPGNIRELQNVIERAAILSPGPALDIPPSDLKPSLGGNKVPFPAVTLEEAERRHILSALEHTNWVLGGPSGAAVRLGMKRSTLQLRLRKLGIRRPSRP